MADRLVGEGIGGVLRVVLLGMDIVAGEENILGTKKEKGLARHFVVVNSELTPAVQGLPIRF